jgi:hypothetical protein
VRGHDHAFPAVTRRGALVQWVGAVEDRKKEKRVGKHGLHLQGSVISYCFFSAVPAS